jgi:hypothetical protein
MKSSTVSWRRCETGSAVRAELVELEAGFGSELSFVVVSKESVLWWWKVMDGRQLEVERSRLELSKLLVRTLLARRSFDRSGRSSLLGFPLFLRPKRMIHNPTKVSLGLSLCKH